MLTGLIGLFMKDPKQKLADEFIKFIETGNSDVTSSRISRFQNIEDFGEAYLPLNDKYVYPIAPRSSNATKNSR